MIFENYLTIQSVHTTENVLQGYSTVDNRKLLSVN